MGCPLVAKTLRSTGVSRAVHFGVLGANERGSEHQSGSTCVLRSFGLCLRSKWSWQWTKIRVKIYTAITCVTSRAACSTRSSQIVKKPFPNMGGVFICLFVLLGFLFACLFVCLLVGIFSWVFLFVCLFVCLFCFVFIGVEGVCSWTFSNEMLLSLTVSTIRSVLSHRWLHFY